MREKEGPLMDDGTGKTTGLRESGERGLMRRLLDGCLEDFGLPRGLENVLADYPQLVVPLVEPERSASAMHSVVRWHTWGLSRNGANRWPWRDDGFLMGWRRSGHYYENHQIHDGDLAAIGADETRRGVELDIGDVEVLYGSKSPLENFETLGEFARGRCAGLLADLSAQALADNLRHDEIRIINRPDGGGDSFAVHLWDGRVCLSNSGGSHHFAAARLIAEQLKQPVPLRGLLSVRWINSGSVEALMKRYEVFALGDVDARASVGFHDALRSFRAAYFWRDLPGPHYDHLRAYFFPRDDGRAMKVAALLREARAADVLAHVRELAGRQSGRWGGRR
jgi:hypothetical protein